MPRHEAYGPALKRKQVSIKYQSVFVTKKGVLAISQLFLGYMTSAARFCRCRAALENS